MKAKKGIIDKKESDDPEINTALILSNLHEERLKLEEELKEIEELLKNSNIFEDNQNVTIKNNTKISIMNQQKNGIRMNHRLSFRGKEKAEEYFHILDENKKNHLIFKDFRAMQSVANGIFGVVHDKIHLNW